MAFNKRNTLNKIIKVQDITLKHTRKGCTQKWVYENIIYPKFCISFSTFCNYLARNAKAELRKMDMEDKRQIPTY